MTTHWELRKNHRTNRTEVYRPGGKELVASLPGLNPSPAELEAMRRQLVAEEKK